VPPACLDQKDERAQSNTFFVSAIIIIIIIIRLSTLFQLVLFFSVGVKCVYHFVEAAGLQQALSAADDNETPNTNYSLRLQAKLRAYSQQ